MATGQLHVSYRQDHRIVQSGSRWFWLVVLGCACLYLPSVLTDRKAFGVALSNDSLLGMSLVQVNVALIAIMAAVALNILTGYTGLISVGNAGFFAVGAAVGGFLGVQHHVPFLAVLLAAGVVGAVVGFVVGLPSLRVRGLYLLLATLAFHYIANYGFLQYQLRYFGATGVLYAKPSVLGFKLSDDRRWFFFLLVLAVGTVLISKNLLRSRQGRALVAIRDRDIAAAATGVNVPVVKLQVFALSSFLITVAGTLYVWYLGNANSDVFSLGLAIDFVAMIIIGGLGSVNGAVLGALVWSLLPQVIKTLSGTVEPTTPVLGSLLTKNSAAVDDIVLGLVIILVLIFKPDGLNGIWVSAKTFFTRWPYTS